MRNRGIELFLPAEAADAPSPAQSVGMELAISLEGAASSGIRARMLAAHSKVVKAAVKAHRRVPGSRELRQWGRLSRCLVERGWPGLAAAEEAWEQVYVRGDPTRDGAAYAASVSRDLLSTDSATAMDPSENWPLAAQMPFRLLDIAKIARYSALQALDRDGALLRAAASAALRGGTSASQVTAMLQNPPLHRLLPEAASQVGSDPEAGSTATPEVLRAAIICFLEGSRAMDASLRPQTVKRIAELAATVQGTAEVSEVLLIGAEAARRVLDRPSVVRLLSAAAELLPRSLGHPVDRDTAAVLSSAITAPPDLPVASASAGAAWAGLARLFRCLLQHALSLSEEERRCSQWTSTANSGLPLSILQQSFGRHTDPEERARRAALHPAIDWLYPLVAAAREWEAEQLDAIADRLLVGFRLDLMEIATPGVN